MCVCVCACVCVCICVIGSRTCKASSAFQSLSRILWHQRKIQTTTKVCVLNSVIIPTLLYRLESTVFLEPHVRRLESFVIHCLQIILGMAVRQKNRHPTIRKMAKQQRISSILTQRCLRFLGHLSRMSNNRLAKQLLVSPLLVASDLLEDRSVDGMMLCPTTSGCAACQRPGGSKPRSAVPGAPPSNTE